VARGGHYTWTTSGPESGLIFQIVVNPADPTRMYAVDSIFGSYLFRTVDRGANWCFVETLAPGVPYLVMNPAVPDVLYVPSYHGVYKSVDGGDSWVSASTGLPDVVSVVALAPPAPDTLYAIAGDSQKALYRTDDGAGHWGAVTGSLPSGSYYGLSNDAFDSSRLYLLADQQPLYRSVDGGATWTPAGAGLPSSANKIFSDPRVVGLIWAATSDGLYRSSDGGVTFTPANVGIEGHDARDVAFDSTDANRLYVATFGPTGNPDVSGGLFVSVDGGTQWSPIDLGIPARHYASSVALDPTDSARVYTGAGTSALRGFLFASSDAGSTWAHAEKGLSGFISYGAVADRDQAEVAIGLSGVDIYRTADRASSWSSLSTVDFWMSSLVADPTNPAALYGPYEGYVGTTQHTGVYKSLDGGMTWSDPSTGLPVTITHQIAIGRSDPQVLLVSTDAGIFRSDDAAATWSSVLTGFGKAVAIDPSDSQILYAGYADTALGNFVRSSDGGQSWNPPSGSPTRWASDVVIPKDDPARVYALFPGNHVYSSTDRGLSFTESSVGLPGFDEGELGVLALDPSSSATLYAAGGLGGAVFRSTDSADTWIPLPSAIPMLTNIDLTVSADGRTLYAAGVAGIFQFSRSFIDVTEADPFRSAVDAAAMNSLTAGCGRGNFCPASPNTRAQVAVFVLRAKNGARFNPPAATGTVFGDVSATSFAAAWIEELSHEGITSGCGGNNYCPSAELSRAEMAVMALRALHGPTYDPPPATGTVFADVPVDAFAAAWIEELFHEGISAGCGGGNFCPDASLTRAQAAALLTRAFQLS
jgi:photosystem II stability/assembly factor-like uncharacterized protein